MSKFDAERYPYRVVRPIVNFGNPTYYASADPISQHLTPEAAWDAINEATAALKRQPGSGTPYVDWTVIDARTLEHCPDPRIEDSHDPDDGYYSEDAYQNHLRDEEDSSDGIAPDGCYWCGSQMHTSASCQHAE